MTDKKTEAQQRHISYVCPQCHWSLEKQPAQQEEPVAVVSGYCGGQCVILPTNPAMIFNSGTAFYTSPPAQQQEPVAKPKLIGWRTENFLWETNDIKKAKNWEPNIGVLPIFEGDPNTQLTPPASKPWVGLTEKEVYDLADADPHGGALRLYRAIEAKLREKNNG